MVRPGVPVCWDPVHPPSAGEPLLLCCFRCSAVGRLSKAVTGTFFYYCGCQRSRINWVYKNKVTSSAACTASPKTGY